MLRTATYVCSIVAMVLLGKPDQLLARQAPPSGPTADLQSGSADRAASFDPVTATEAYLSRIPPDKSARSDAYFEGGYWLRLWNFLWQVSVFVLLLQTGLSARMRDMAERFSRWRWLRPALYWCQFLLVATVLTFPLSVYEGFIREHQYGLATQSFGPWLWDQTKGLFVGLLFGALGVVALYAVLRRTPRTWWLSGSAVVIALIIFGAIIAPVYIDPIFNTYTRIEDPDVRDPILKLAHANGIASDDVYLMDASRQTTRISANVSGLFGTERVTLNDNLLNRCSMPEIEAVLGHEIGHYVLNHVFELIVYLGLVAAVGFAFVQLAFDRTRTRWGGKWNVRGVADVAGFPLLALLLTAYGFVMLPMVNTIIRSNEYEADVFGLNAARQPDGFAEVALKLADYRKLAPGPLEEWLMYDHPSGRTRIFTAMRWKAELGPSNEASPQTAK